MITYLASFIPCLSEHTTPLRRLLQKDVLYDWQHEHKQAFQKLKQLINNANKLQYFNPQRPSIVQVDASQYALGAALIQDNQVIAYASKSLTTTESRYANIEREMLACVFGAERFHTYLYGAPFSIQTDHKPLEMIIKKSINAAPARLQRMLLRLQKYDVNIQYCPGKEMILPDSLSRLPNTATGEEIKLNMTVSFVSFSQERIMELREATQQDELLSLLKEYIIEGFPEKQRELPPELRPYFSIRDELSIENGMILKGEQLIIPKLLQQWYLNAIHQGHQGITRCQQLAKSTIYWLGINNDIEKMINNCEPCQKHRASQPSESNYSIADDLPNIPWYTISADLLTVEGKHYLTIADYYTKYPFVESLTDLSSKAITEIMRKITAMFGIPNTIITDNGPQFIGSSFQAFVKEYGISHITSSPHHPKSHGFI